MTPIHNWALATTGAIALLVLGALLDGPDDLATDANMAAAKADALAQARATHTQGGLEDAVRALCTDLHGNRAVVLRTQDGDLVCRRGPALLPKAAT